MLLHGSSWSSRQTQFCKHVFTPPTISHQQSTPNICLAAYRMSWQRTTNGSDHTSYLRHKPKPCLQVIVFDDSVSVTHNGQCYFALLCMLFHRQHPSRAKLVAASIMYTYCAVGPCLNPLFFHCQLSFARQNLSVCTRRQGRLSI